MFSSVLINSFFIMFGLCQQIDTLKNQSRRVEIGALWQAINSDQLTKVSSFAN